MKIAPILLIAALVAGCVETSQTRSTTESTSAPAAAPAVKTPAALDAAATARVEKRVEEQLRKLEPEYWLRRGKEGEEAANAWLKSQAIKIKTREIEVERKALGQ